MAEAATVEKKLDNPEEAPAVEVPEIVCIQPIPVGRLSLQVEESNTYRVNVPQGTEPEQVMDESVWAHIGIRLKPCDEIIVMPDDGSWKLLLHVQSAGRNYAHVIKEVLYELAPTKPAVKLASIYKIEWGGTTDKWRVLREGRLLRTGFEAEGLARRYAANHEMVTDR